MLSCVNAVHESDSVLKLSNNNILQDIRNENFWILYFFSFTIGMLEHLLREYYTNNSRMSGVVDYNFVLSFL